MTDLDRGGGDRHGHIRRILGELRRVPASGDFEVRLRRRLAAQAPERRGFRTVPVLAYSIAAILAVGVISMWLILRSGSPSGESPVVLPDSGESTPQLDRTESPAPGKQSGEKGGQSARRDRESQQSPVPEVREKKDLQPSAVPGGMQSAAKGRAEESADRRGGVPFLKAAPHDTATKPDSLKADSLKSRERK